MRREENEEEEEEEKEEEKKEREREREREKARGGWTGPRPRTFPPTRDFNGSTRRIHDNVVTVK